MRTITALAAGLMLVGCGESKEYPAMDRQTGLFGTARVVGDQECFTPSQSAGVTQLIEAKAAGGEPLSDADQAILAGEVCGPPSLPPNELVLATCARVERAHA